MLDVAGMLRWVLSWGVFNKLVIFYVSHSLEHN